MTKFSYVQYRLKCWSLHALIGENSTEVDSAKHSEPSCPINTHIRALGLYVHVKVERVMSFYLLPHGQI